jgi:hypothetical protein
MESASSMPESASMIKVRFPYLYLCLEIVTSLKMGAGVNTFDQEFNGIEDFCWWNSNWKHNLEN